MYSKLKLNFCHVFNTLKLLSHYKLMSNKLYGFYKFGFSIEIEGDPRKLKIGKSTYIEKGVILCIRKGSIEIGNNCIIRRGVILSTEGGNIIIGNNTSINPYCIIYGDGDTSIGNGVRIAGHTVIVPANHNFSDKTIPIINQGLSKKGIKILNDVWIGSGVTVLDGVTINNGVVVGAGSVVNSEIPEFALCVGVPAKVIKYRQ
jgi:acetyltransferase-like isoleucine patch superfamily enzyme